MSPVATKIYEVTLDIGDMPIVLRTGNPEYVRMLEARYGSFVNSHAGPSAMELDVNLLPSPKGRRWDDGSLDQGEPQSDPIDVEAFADPDDDVKVKMESGRWTMERGDFRAEWDPPSHRGWVQQTVNPYSIDGVLRILHSLILAKEGGLLVHAASAVRNGRAFVFAGVSGAGKTTISRLAPPGVKLLTDEISYLRGARSGRLDAALSCRGESVMPPAGGALPPATGFMAYGTPFAGELAKIGEKLKAPLAGLYLLSQGEKNKIEDVSEAQAVRELMRHVLFFAHDAKLVELVFETVCELVRRVPVQKLVFKKDPNVWELIG